MKKQMFMALVATTILSSVAMASISSEQTAVRADAVQQGETLPCGKLVSTVKRTTPEKLIEPTEVAMAQPSKGAQQKNGSKIQ